MIPATPSRYRVPIQGWLRYTLVAGLYVVAIGSILLATKQRGFHWYTWATLAVFLVGIVTLLLEVPPAKNPAYGWFHNWLASARRRPGFRYSSIALWILIPIGQVAIATKRGHMDYFTWFVVCAAPVVLFRFTWPLPKSWPQPKTN
jgi:hypothetical protein